MTSVKSAVPTAVSRLNPFGSVTAAAAGGQDGDFRRAGPAAAPDCLQGSEAEVAGADRSEAHFLEAGIILNIGERAGNDVGRPGRTV